VRTVNSDTYHNSDSNQNLSVNAHHTYTGGLTNIKLKPGFRFKSHLTRTRGRLCLNDSSMNHLTSHVHGKINLVHTALYTMQNLLTSHVHRRIILIISSRNLNDIITPRTNREDYAKLSRIRLKIRRISSHTYMGRIMTNWSLCKLCTSL